MKIGSVEIKWQRIAAFIGIAILVLLIMDFNSRLEEMTRLNRQAETVRVRATEIMATQYNLQTAVAYANSSFSVEEWAREQAGMIQPGDVPIKPMPVPGATPPAQDVSPVIVPTQVSNWQIWLMVIFGN
jgi:cell division protein FtsB